MSSWLKFGLIGAGIVLVLTLLGQISFLACITGPLVWLTYIAVGVLAARDMLPPRDAGKAAGQGALAALLASIVGGLVSSISGIIRAASGSTAAALGNLPPGILEMLEDAGMDPGMIVDGATSVGLAAVTNLICCGIGIFIAAALGAIGGAIFAAVRRD